MTEGQYKFQALMEDQRHNLAMESYSKQQAQAAAVTAGVKLAEMPYEVSLLKAQTKKADREGNRAQMDAISNIVFGAIKYVLPTADTVVRAAASLFS